MSLLVQSVEEFWFFWGWMAGSAFLAFVYLSILWMHDKMEEKK